MGKDLYDGRTGENIRITVQNVSCLKNATVYRCFREQTVKATRIRSAAKAFCAVATAVFHKSRWEITNAS